MVVVSGSFFERPLNTAKDTAVIVMPGPPKGLCLSSLILTIVFLLLSLEGSALVSSEKHRLYGDVSEDERAIDHLEEYHLLPPGAPPPPPSIALGAAPVNQYPPPYQTDFPTFHSALKIGEKIEFGVSPKDPRYYLPSSVLREGAALPQPDLDVVGGSGARNNPLLRAGELHPSHHSPLVRELFSRFSPLIYGTVGGSSIDQDGVVSGGHKFGPLPPSASRQGTSSADSESSDTGGDSVSFLQKSHHQAEVPYYVQQHGGASGAVMSDFYFIAIVSGFTAAAVCAAIGAGICYLRLHKNKRDAADAEYPAYGVTGPCSKDFSPAAADRKLAQSAHMFHYQHQKQQMIALEKSSGDERHCSASDVDSEEEGEEGDYTVYECPGLAPTGEMEVKNPLFNDDPTPAATPATTTAAAGARQKGTAGSGSNKKDAAEETEEE